MPHFLAPKQSAFRAPELVMRNLLFGLGSVVKASRSKAATLRLVD
jgi:hypothetical protein